MAAAETLTPRAMIDRLVGIPTVSRDSNLELIDSVANYLAGHGVEARLVRSDCGRKANLLATIGPLVEGGVVLSGHTDVVPIDDQDWHSDPFTVTEHDGKLYGRGTSDMKAFIAIALALVPEMTRLQRPVHLAFSYDEEIGCLGAPRLIEAITAEIPHPQAVFVGEPTLMQVVTGHKGIFHFHTRVTGHEAHSSQQHRGVPAVMVAGRLVNWLAEQQDRNRAAADPGNGFEPAYSTLHCGVINGGTAHNITARHCEFATDIRCIPGDTPEQFFDAFTEYAKSTLEPEMHAIHPDTGIEFDVTARVPPYGVDDDEPAVRLARFLTGQNDTAVVPYGAESGQFQQAGYSVAMCGPGSIDQAHQPDEFIALSQVEAGTAFIRRLINHLSGES